MTKCANCGEMFAGQPGDAFCVPCEIKIQKHEPPQHLKDMRTVYSGQDPETPGQRLLKQIMDQKPADFLARLEAAEKEWRVGTKEETMESDQGSERVEGLIEELLGKMREKP